MGPVELTVLAVVSVISVVLHYGIGNYGVHSVIGGTVIGFALWFALGMGLAIVSVALEGSVAHRGCGCLQTGRGCLGLEPWPYM